MGMVKYGRIGASFALVTSVHCGASIHAAAFLLMSLNYLSGVDNFSSSLRAGSTYSTPCILHPSIYFQK